ncbi:MAG: hypothetical protein WCQ20_03515 [Synechococcaceae cyanobacterium ELA739]|jgi:hypothetical protein
MASALVMGRLTPSRIMDASRGFVREALNLDWPLERARPIARLAR